MGKSKKKFIDKKNSVTFNLVHRSQRDPLIADENAPQHVLVEADNKQTKEDKVSVEKRKEEQAKWGVFYDDDYDYLQHLRDMKDLSIIWAPSTVVQKEKTPMPEKKEKPRIVLPSSVFASEVEEPVGMLNKAAPQTSLRLDLDPDIVAAMDEDYNYEDPDNQLEDNFMELAMGGGEDEEEKGSDEDDYDDDKQSQVGYASDNQWSDSEEEYPDVQQSKYDNDDAKTRFSQYSMSSSIMRRNNGLSLLDDKFEKMFAEYDQTEIGALECDDIEGHLPPTTEILQNCAEHFYDQRRFYKLDDDKEAKKIVKLAQLKEVSDEEDDVDLFGNEEKVKEKWDCESILTTYSNLYNHPRLIEEPKRQRKIKINPKTGIPVGVLNSGAPKLTMKSLARFNMQQVENERAQNSGDDEESICESVMSTLSVLSLRPKDETPEEKKERKRLLREYRHERRIEKKANIQAFKEEKKRQDKISVNNKQNIQGIKII